MPASGTSVCESTGPVNIHRSCATQIIPSNSLFPGRVGSRQYAMHRHRRTRQPSEDGCRRAAKLARLFVADGFTVVSGLARGIDTVAPRRRSLQADSQSRFWHSHYECYPARTRAPAANRGPTSRDQDQVPSSAIPRQHFAPTAISSERNATMSALPEATVIIEAG